jgi:hypothetical protein
MKRVSIVISLVLVLSGSSGKLFAWGKTGHELVAEIAFRFLDDSTKKMVSDFLGDMTLSEAGNWMDESKSNTYYDYMRSWHYLDMDKGEKYTPSSERNILNVLHTAITELRQYKTISKKDVKRDLLLIFHLIGDLHQPLHCGYAIDKGGNTVSISSPAGSGNLHGFWDSQIIDYKKITIDSCLALYNNFDSSTVAGITKINELKWMYQSRSHLDKVYSFKDNYLDINYVDQNAEVIKRQILMGGLRLASILKSAFNPSAKLNATPAEK